MRTVLLVAASLGVLAAFWAIGDTFLIVFVGIFLALVFEFPLRYLMSKTKMSRGAAAAVVVLGTFALILLVGLLFLVPLVGSVRDFLQDLPVLVEKLRASDELSGLGDSGAAGNRGRLLLRLPRYLHDHLHLHVSAQRHREPEAGVGERAHAG